LKVTGKSLIFFQRNGYFLFNWILIISGFLFINAAKAQDSRWFQDSSKFDPLLLRLEIQLFPFNTKEDNRISIYDCITSNDSLILYGRRHQPNVDSVLILLKKIAFEKNYSNIEPLLQMQHGQTLYFQMEWEAAFRQSTRDRCKYFNDQLMILVGLDRCIRSLESGKLYSSGAEYFKYLVNLNDATAKYYLYSYFTDPQRVSSGLLNLDSTSLKVILDLPKELIEECKKYTLLTKDSYLRSIYENQFSAPNRSMAYGINKNLEWDYYSPYQDLISPYIIQYKKELESFPEKVSLDYFIHFFMFFSTIPYITKVIE